MDLLLLSFFAGILTVLAPCVLPLLPVIIGGSLADNRIIRPIVITTSLAISIVIFTLVLKASTALIEIPQAFWTYFSGGIILLFALSLLFPFAWAKLMLKITPKKFSLKENSEKVLFEQNKKDGYGSMILIGAALGPVFASCSPTYFLILGTVLPASYFVGILNLVAYAVGLSLVMFIVAFAGQKMLSRVNNISDPRGWFKRGLGILFLIVAIAILTGYDKKIEAKILDSSFNISNFEQGILDRRFEAEDAAREAQLREQAAQEEIEQNPLLNKNYPAPNLEGLENWINSESIASMDELEGKVVMIDFWTYSCINCIRTLGHNQDLWEQYQDKDFVLLGIHAPEFAFEHKIENVKNAVAEYGLTYPVVQDNDFATWDNYNNRYWPAIYIIDKAGNVRFTHFGEGKYQEIEEVVDVLVAQPYRDTLSRI